ncbi:FtsW/RodA/SpoVE family cell cycle protein, partial [Escherichia coli]|uniref:FtsW/RodA/SpoVE family cell cycle protein n=1 Tax=Escherichia coli TaxID=562 RepID=UPI003BA15D8E
LPTHFLTRHMVAIGFGLTAGLITVQIPVSVWERWAPWVFVVALVLLVAVLIPGVGRYLEKRGLSGSAMEAE